MTDGTPDVLRLLQQAEVLPQDELGEQDSTVAYDPGLIAELEQHGAAALAEFGKITVRDTGEPSRYAAAVWYALKHDLQAENVGNGVVLISDPKAASEE